MTQRVLVTDRSCDHCTMSVREAIQKLAGVSAVSVDLQRGVATVEVGAEIPLETYKEAVAGAGFTVGAVE